METLDILFGSVPKAAYIPSSKIEMYKRWKIMEPKVFISYSWSDQNHQELVKQWAERLMADGVEVILDIYDLKEGHDKYAFMERMVTDPSVTHVLVICDKKYAEKADSCINYEL